MQTIHSTTVPYLFCFFRLLWIEPFHAVSATHIPKLVATSMRTRDMVTLAIAQSPEVFIIGSKPLYL